MSTQCAAPVSIPFSPPGSESAGKNVGSLRQKFPIFARHPDLIYFDSAATSQKPQSVLDEINGYFGERCSNAGRASYTWSTQLEKSIGHVREKVAAFIGAEESELAFTSGATESLNSVALAWGLKNLRDGDEIMLCRKDHESAVLPWYNLKAMLAVHGKNIRIKTFDIHEVGDYDLKSIREQLSDRTRLIALTHIHHVFGLDMEVKDIREIVGPDVLISLDASQSAGHIKLDVKALGVDFLSFSGHKMFAATGTGALWVNPDVREFLHPCKLGGKGRATAGEDGLRTPRLSASEFFEAGTLNIPGILSLGRAVEFIQSVGQQAIEHHVSDLTVYLYRRLADLPGIIFTPGMGECRCDKGYGILSFQLEQIPSIDLGFLLDEERIFVRAGNHCIYEKHESEDFVRVSMHAYNSREEIDRLMTVLEGAVG